MGSLDFGKLTTIALIFFIISFFFGGKIMFWLDHRDDLQFNLSQVVYTKKHFESLDEAEKNALLDEVTSLCVRKHHIDGINCSDTSYWFANNLEEKGVEGELAIDLMETCHDSCQSKKYIPQVYVEHNKVTGEKMDRPAQKSKGTQWFWER